MLLALAPLERAYFPVGTSVYDILLLIGLNTRHRDNQGPDNRLGQTSGH
jgi:hypothetical protein